jgi:hypothetical protein
LPAMSTPRTSAPSFAAGTAQEDQLLLLAAPSGRVHQPHDVGR